MQRFYNLEAKRITRERHAAKTHRHSFEEKHTQERREKEAHDRRRKLLEGQRAAERADLEHRQ
eukprot:8700319-Pyramimonas_sp.AAC.1